MDIRAIILPLCLALAPCSAQEPVEAAATQNATPSQEELATRLFAMLDPYAAQICELHQLLSGIKDEESADAAAWEVEQTMRRLQQTALLLMDSRRDCRLILTELEGMGVDATELIHTHYAETIEKEAECGRLFQALRDMDPPFYGSQSMHLLFISGVGDNGFDEDDYALTMFDAIDIEVSMLCRSLAEIQNKEDADDFAAGAVGLRDGMEAVFEFVSYLDIVEDEMWQDRMGFVRERVNHVSQTSTYGSEALETYLWGWKHLDSLFEQDADISDFANCTNSYGLFVELAGDLEEGVSRITDRDSADRAASSIHAILDVACKLMDDRSPYAADPEGFEKWISFVSGGTWEDADARIRACIDSCRAKGFYGSPLLKAAMQDYEKPVLPYEDEVRIATPYIQANLDKTREMAAILLGITDRASADAAAPRVLALRHEIDANWEAMRQEIGGARLLCSPRHQIMRSEANEAFYEAAEELDGIIYSLGEQDFFGSEALHDALTQPQDAPAQRTPNPVPSFFR